MANNQCGNKMAKAIFHKSQRVYVKPVGTWAHVEQIIPKWAQGIDEPIRIYYDIGMGRPFMADELEAEDVAVGRDISKEGEWRILRGQNKWRAAEECQHHPNPGTHPIIATGDLDWGGWRVPSTEYDRDPHRIEQQAQIISKAPVLAGLLSELVRLSDEIGDDLPSSLHEIAVRARKQLIDAGLDIGVLSANDETDMHAPAIEKTPSQFATRAPAAPVFGNLPSPQQTRSPIAPPQDPGEPRYAAAAALS